MPPYKPTVLCILDGWGLRDEAEGNAVALSHTPCYDRIMANCPNTTLITYGPDVGLPEGQMGNSEVGHMNIGAGRIVEMGLQRIDNAIKRGTLSGLPGMQRFIEKMKASAGTAHLLSVMSDGGVHAQLSHLIETIAILCQAGIPVAIHAFTDGRDVAPKSALKFLQALEANLPENAQIATICGRYYAMDRDNRWDRVALAYQAMVSAQGAEAASPKAAVTQAYEQGLTDEFILPTTLPNYEGMKSGDGILCLNFRADRVRQIMAALADPDFSEFETPARPEMSIATGFTQYSNLHAEFMDVIFPNVDLANTLGAWVAKKGLRQFRIAETEKYPHVTFFFNGGVESPARDEHRYLAPSPKVATYDLQPEMSSTEVTDQLTRAIGDGGYDLIVVNYANPDMVGHTGDLTAAIAACEAVDRGLSKVIPALEKAGGAMLLTADHGNCETMINPATGGPHTAHTTNPVPLALFGGPEGAELQEGGRLADLAPTLLWLMGLDTPAEMTGNCLIVMES